jgi:hypothetical protein
MQKKEAHAEAQRRREDNAFAFSAPLSLCVIFPAFICVHLILSVAKNPELGFRC